MCTKLRIRYLLKCFKVEVVSLLFIFKILMNYCLYVYLLNQARAWFPEIVFRKVCVCLYVCMYICLSFRTHVSKPFT